MSGEWRDGTSPGFGHFYLSGSADKSIGSVDFEAWLQLWIQNGSVDVEILSTRQDGNWLLDVADFFTAGLVTRTIEEVIPQALMSIGGQLFGDIGVFAEVVPPEAEFAAMEITGPVGIWNSGLSIPAKRAPSFAPSPVKPDFLRGHRDSREFHKSTCDVGKLIKKPIFFPTWMKAVQSGYNGCWYCEPDYNVVRGPIVRSGCQRRRRYPARGQGRSGKQRS